MNFEKEPINVKIFSMDGSLLVEKEVPFKKFRIMKELDLLTRDGSVNKNDIDVERTIEYLNENNKCLRIKSILVADDEEILRELYEAQIGRFCHYVEVYASAIEALESFQSNPLKYDFILSDNIMPEMKGDEFSDKVREVKPDIPIYIITGDSDSVNPESFNNSVSGIIKKPINADQLKSFIGEGKVDKFSREDFSIKDQKVA